MNARCCYQNHDHGWSWKGILFLALVWLLAMVMLYPLLPASERYLPGATRAERDAIELHSQILQLKLNWEEKEHAEERHGRTMADEGRICSKEQDGLVFHDPATDRFIKCVFFPKWQRWGIYVIETSRNIANTFDEVTGFCRHNAKCQETIVRYLGRANPKAQPFPVDIFKLLEH